jgi:hypothetical protein
MSNGGISKSRLGRMHTSPESGVLSLESEFDDVQLY